MTNQDSYLAWGTSLWNSGLDFGDTVWQGVADVATATGGALSEEYDALTDTAYEVVTAPAKAAQTVAEGAAQAASDAAGTVAEGAAEAARILAEETANLLDDIGDAVKIAPFVIGGVGLAVFVAYKKGLFK